jgi:hypothetical protein
MYWQVGWQDVVALLLVLGAGWYLFRRVKRAAARPSGTACGTCDRCTAPAKGKAPLPIVPPPTRQDDADSPCR